MHEASRPFSADTLASLPLSAVTTAAMATLHPIQTLTPEEQVAGAAVLFRIVCQRAGLTGQGMWDFADRVLSHPPTPEAKVAQNSLQALRDFAGLRIAGDERVSFG